ncbi:MAG: porphobilinogen synthase [Candidatus Wallbacteria bacterium]|nr:porphobilinogen synthase [Candidatus Wallbacteria bacterium]
MQFPISRPRRLRKSEAIRRMVRETRMTSDNLILPAFVVAGEGVRQEIGSMPGFFRFSVDKLEDEAKEARDLGLPAMLLFGIPESKDPLGSGAWADDGIVQRAMRRLKEKVPELLLFGDVCMCEYTSHGHCGELVDGEVANDRTLELLAKTAVSQARAGADLVAPSDMMDGRVGAIRDALDEAGFSDVPIMSYAAKYASGFYGPFREAAESTPAMGDRRGYQMDPANVREALKEVALDVGEGADILMVKPAIPYLDVITRVRDAFELPVAAYHVSGEYSMLKAAALQGWLDEKRCALESITAIRRAGADLVITYYAKDLARWL